MRFKDRIDAGIQLAEQLKRYTKEPNAIVLGLARGGVVVASEVASLLKLAFDVLVVRKLRAPENEELAIGAIAERGDLVLNESLLGVLGVTNAYIEREIEVQKELACKRGAMYREGRRSLPLEGKIVILIDDGIATGASMRAAILAVRASGASKIVLATPVASSEALTALSQEVNETVCVYTPFVFPAVGSFYKSFLQISDSDVMHLLEKRPLA